VLSTRVHPTFFDLAKPLHLCRHGFSHAASVVMVVSITLAWLKLAAVNGRWCVGGDINQTSVYGLTTFYTGTCGSIASDDQHGWEAKYA